MMSVPPATSEATSTTCKSRFDITTSFQVANVRLGVGTNPLLPYPPPLATNEHGLALTFIHFNELLSLWVGAWGLVRHPK
jgi:hypothetical protein